MARVPLRRVVGIVAAVAVATAVLRALRSSSRSGSGGAVLPAVTGDTWPPVPANPDRAL